MMENVTSAFYEMVNYTTALWPLDDNVINSSNHNVRESTMSMIVTPFALAATAGKHHKHAHFDSVSPVTLSTEWSRLTRLIFLTILSVIGSIGNIFMISSVMVEDHLKKAGKEKFFSSFSSFLQKFSLAFFRRSFILLLTFYLLFSYKFQKSST
jgi:Na+/melibiose symporter-like transporter